jgi:hypothetical protein
MKYTGPLFGKIGRKCFDTGRSSEDWDRMENLIAALDQAIGTYRAALDEISELSETGDASSSRDYGDIARKALDAGAKIQTANNVKKIP